MGGMLRKQIKSAERAEKQVLSYRRISCNRIPSYLAAASVRMWRRVTDWSMWIGVSPLADRLVPVDNGHGTVHASSLKLKTDRKIAVRRSAHELVKCQNVLHRWKSESSNTAKRSGTCFICLYGLHHATMCLMWTKYTSDKHRDTPHQSLHSEGRWKGNHEGKMDWLTMSRQPVESACVAVVPLDKQRNRQKFYPSNHLDRGCGRCHRAIWPTK